jgi:hypothetical protein
VEGGPGAFGKVEGKPENVVSLMLRGEREKHCVASSVKFYRGAQTLRSSLHLAVRTSLKGGSFREWARIGPEVQFYSF